MDTWEMGNIRIDNCKRVQIHLVKAELYIKLNFDLSDQE